MEGSRMLPLNEQTGLQQLQLELGRTPYGHYPDDLAAWTCVDEALAALAEGNFGIGAVLVDPGGQTVRQGHNKVFKPHFRSDGHAEMVVLRDFETICRDTPLRGYTLYTSLESCPMCMARLITAGVSRVLHIADDPQAGMVHLAHQLPPVWRELASEQRFESARCSPALKDLATQAFMLNVRRLDGLLKAR